MNINQNLQNLRNVMKKYNINYYIIPSQDFHQSEYVGDYFKSREFITGFDGSAGTAVITLDKAYLWTDGRYFIQASKQLENTEIELMKSGEPNVPAISSFLEENVKNGEVLGFDGRVISVEEGKTYEAIFALKNGNIVYEHDLIDEIWTQRPSMSTEKAFLLEEKYSGKSTKEKIQLVRQKMIENNASHHILATLDDICWLLNIRGNDVAYSPLVLSYVIMTKNEFFLYVDENKLDTKIKNMLNENNIVVKPYNSIYEDVKNTKNTDTILMDFNGINYSLFNNIPMSVAKINKTNPEILLKALKNETEIDNTKKAEIMDSVAHVKFMKWLKENYDKIEMTEISVSEKLEEFRKENPSYLQPSFAPISAFGQHGAIIHYSATTDTDAKITEGKLHMTDTGANYYEGSTDITRTYAIGNVSDIMKEHFTITLISHLNLSNAKFLEGCCGSNLDILARTPFWERGLNYNHGTGHGVGYLLNIHEGPHSMRYSTSPQGLYPLKEGMIVTNEPGIYIENSHGIRLENELLVVKDYKNDYGQFMKFETLTFVPFDLDAIKIDILSDVDKIRLNDYHKAVYDKISPYLNDEEKAFLKKYTKAI